MTQLQCGLLAHEVVQEIPNGFWSHVLVGAGEVGKIHYCGGEASRKRCFAAPAALFRPAALKVLEAYRGVEGI